MNLKTNISIHLMKLFMTIIVTLDTIFSPIYMIIQKIKKYNKIDIFLLSIIFISLLIFLMTIPIYFKGDDITWLWIAKNYNPLEMFQLSTVGYYRPVVNIMWWLGFNLWGTNPIGYQLILGTTFIGSMVFLYKIGNLFGEKFAGLFSFLSFLAGFGFLLYILLWLSDINKTTCLFFMSIGLFFLFLHVKEGKKISLYLGIFFSVLAMLSREISIFIIPITFLFYYISIKYKEYSPKKFKIKVSFKLILTSIILALACIIFIMNPFIQNRIIDIFYNAGLLEQVSSKLNYYSNVIVNSFGGLLFIILALTFTFINLKKTKLFYFIISIIIILSISFISNIDLKLVLLLISLLSCLYLGNTSQRTFLIWFISGIIPLLLIKYQTQSYLLEAFFGLSIFMGITITSILAHLKNFYLKKRGNILKKGKKSNFLNLLVIASVIVLLIISLNVVIEKMEPTSQELNEYKHYQSNYKEFYDFLASKTPKSSTIYFVPEKEYKNERINQTYSEPTNSKYLNFAYDEVGSIQKMFFLMGRPDLQIESTAEIGTNTKNSGEFIFVQNNFENEIIKQKGIKLKTVKASDDGQLIIYEIE